MTTNMTNRNDVLSQGVATQTVGAESTLLGYVVSFSVGEADYDRNKMEQALIDNGLDVGYLPNPVDPVDAFARASKGCELKSWKPKEDSKVYKNFTVRDVVRSGERRIKNIVVETVNAERERLDYDTEGAILKYTLKTNDLETTWNDPTCEVLVEQMKLDFEKYCNSHNGNTVRGSITKLLNSMSPILMRQTGGVYFVPVQYADKILATVSYINSLEKGDAFAVPMVNNSDGQALLRNKFEEHLQNVLNDCRKVMNYHNGDVDDSPAAKKKRTEMEKKALETAQIAVEQFKDYKAILQGEISQIEGCYDLVKSAVLKMTELGIKPIKKRK